MAYKRICFYGGPGTGKSALAMAVTAALKASHYPVELVDEAIKPMAWQDIRPEGFDSVWLFGKQIRREDVVLRNRGYVVSAGPSFMQVYYMKCYGEQWYPEFEAVAKIFEEKYPAINFYLERVVPYQEEGRYEPTEEEARNHDQKILDFISWHHLSYHRVDPRQLENVMQLITLQLADPKGPQTY